VINASVSWRLSLAVSAVTLLAVPVVWRHVTRTPPSTERFDTRGVALLIAFATGVVLMPAAPLVALGAVPVTGALFAWHLRRRPTGFVPATLLRSRAFLGAAATALTLSTSYFALLFAAPHLIAHRTTWSAGAIGVGQLAALLLGSTLSWLLAATSGRLSRTTAYVTLLGVGGLAAITAVLATLAPLLLLATAAANFAATGSNAILGASAGQAVPERQRPAAIGLFILSYQLGGALGPAIAALLVLS
jgi:hypothetical protein